MDLGSKRVIVNRYLSFDFEFLLFDVNRCRCYDFHGFIQNEIVLFFFDSGENINLFLE